MALTREEQLELDQLEKELGSKKSGLSPEEEKELASLEAEFGQAPQVAAEPERPMFTKRGLLKGVAESLPTAGAMFGGAAGSVAGPAGTFAGAGAGGLLGKAGEQLMERYLLDEEKPREQYYSELAQGPAEGMAGELVGPGINAVKSGIKGAGKQLATNVAGLSPKAVETYAKATKDVDKIIEKYGGEIGKYADEIRTGLLKKIDQFKQAQNSIIGEVSEGSTKRVPVKGTIDLLERNLGKINKDINPKGYGLIEDQLNVLRKISDDAGTVSARDANDMVRTLQELSAFTPEGQVKVRKGNPERILKMVSANLNKEFKKAVPEIKEPYKNLAKFRKITEGLGRNITTPETGSGALFSAGLGKNQAVKTKLEKLGNLLDEDFVGQAEKMASAREMGQAGLLPSQQTGMKLLPMALMSAGGAGVGAYATPEDAMGGAAKGLLAGSLASPGAMRRAIQLGSKLSPVAEKIPTRGASKAGLLYLLRGDGEK